MFTCNFACVASCVGVGVWPGKGDEVSDYGTGYMEGRRKKKLEWRIKEGREGERWKGKDPHRFDREGDRKTK